MAGDKADNPPTAAKKTGASKAVVQEALQVTWVLKGHLKNVQVAYIRAGKLLGEVREKKLYEALGHPDLESYAETRLNLGRASLYRYVQVYSWIRDFHPAWLAAKPQGFIPELTDVADLMWLERELARKDLGAGRRATLEELRQKAMEGKLRTGDLDRYRSAARPRDSGKALKSFLSKLRSLRMRGAQLASMPPEAIGHLDAAIEILNNASTLQLARLDLAETEVRTALA